jgi:CRP-like cAMP-binding protein
MRNRDSVADALGRTARYGNCPRRERQAISQASTLLEVPAGTVLAHEGTLHRQFVIVLSGGATVRMGDRVRSALLAGDHFGDVTKFDDGPSGVSVVAETPMKVAVVSAADFGPMLDSSPTLTRHVLAELAAKRSLPTAPAAVQDSTLSRKLRGFAVAARSAALRSTQKSFRSGSASHTQPIPSSLR